MVTLQRNPVKTSSSVMRRSPFRTSIATRLPAVPYPGRGPGCSERQYAREKSRTSFLPLGLSIPQDLTALSEPLPLDNRQQVLHRNLDVPSTCPRREEVGRTEDMTSSLGNI